MGDCSRGHCAGESKVGLAVGEQGQGRLTMEMLDGEIKERIGNMSNGDGFVQ